MDKDSLLKEIYRGERNLLATRLDDLEEKVDYLIEKEDKTKGIRSLVEGFNDTEEHFTRRLYHKERKRRIYLEKHPLQVFLFMVVCVLIAGVSQLYTNWSDERAKADAEIESYEHNVTLNFISQIAGSAQAIASANDLYASVMIAQAVLESESGTSGLGAPPHYNLFGIKGVGTNGSVVKQTWEDDGKGNAYIIDAEFRAYNSWYESLLDNAEVLSWSYYDGVHKSNTTSYADATAALTGKYATDTMYWYKLNTIIDRYNLTQYDGSNNSSVSTSQALVWNEYREAYTTQDVLNEDNAWKNR